MFIQHDLTLGAPVERDATNEPDSGSSGSSGESSPDWVGMVRSLREALPEQEGMSPGRAAKLASILSRFEQAVADPDHQAGAGKVGELMAQMAQTLVSPTRPEPGHEPVPGSRRAALTEIVDALYGTVAREASEGVSDAVAALYADLRDIRDRLHAASDDDVLGIESEALRPLAGSVREFALRRHLTFARPVWPATKISPDPGAVFVSGGSRLRDLMEPLSAERDLRVLAEAGHREPASARWEQLRSSAVAVFDPMAPDSSPQQRATAFYELGMALAVGRPVVIVTDEPKRLPFDVDVEPVVIGGDADDAETLAAAVDAALYGVQRGEAGDSVRRSLDWLRRYVEEHESPAMLKALDVFDDDAADDPTRARARAATALNHLRSGRPEIVLPIWPGCYPDPAEQRCFHVTAFRQKGARTTQRLLNQACSGSEVFYLRGDEARTPDIMRSIWDEIGRATHVVVDMTGLNDNVLLELGIAHVLGRNVLLISQDPPETFTLWPRPFAKIRCHPYVLTGDGDGDGDGEAALLALFHEFLATSPGAPVPDLADSGTDLGATPSPRFMAQATAAQSLPAGGDRVSAPRSERRIGRAVLNTGKAYVQHVRFVERARRLPRQEVAAALDEYLASLSEPARIGFGLTLTLLAKREKQDAQRRSFIQALSAAVASADKAGSRGRPDVTRVEVDEHGGPSASQVDGSASTPSTTSGTTDVVPFEVAMVRNEEILASWVRLPAHARERAIDEHLSV